MQKLSSADLDTRFFFNMKSFTPLRPLYYNIILSTIPSLTAYFPRLILYVTRFVYKH